MMKIKSLYITIILVSVMGVTSCSNTGKSEVSESNASSDTPKDHGDEDKHGHGDEHGEELTLTQKQIDLLGIKIDTIPKRNMNGFIQVNGQLGVPPQNEAIVTTILGANVTNIKVIEGDEVRKGQILAYISHPDIITLQTDYLQTYNKLTFLEQDYNRQKKLYDAGVGSGRDYQQAKSAFSSAKGLVKGYESQLQLLGLSAKSVREGAIAEVAPVRSPIHGFVEKVKVKSGQYVQPQTPLVEIVNTEHIHADLMVFEKDISKVKNGQLVKFHIEALGGKELTAKIYSVGKSFEEGPKALHVHAEIKNKDTNLVPGMYVSARIITEKNVEQALPEEAIFQEGEMYYIFTAKKGDGNLWEFTPKEVITKSTSNGYISFDFKEDIRKNVLVAQSGAYYLIAEMKKSEAEHSH